jgi:hypothetical protein
MNAINTDEKTGPLSTLDRRLHDLLKKYPETGFLPNYLIRVHPWFSFSFGQLFPDAMRWLWRK